MCCTQSLTFDIGNHEHQSFNCQIWCTLGCWIVVWKGTIKPLREFLEVFKWNFYSSQLDFPRLRMRSEGQEEFGKRKCLEMIIMMSFNLVVPVRDNGKSCRVHDLSDKQDMHVSSEVIRNSVFGMHYLSNKQDTCISYITC